MASDEWAAMRDRRRPTDDEWALAEQQYSPGTVVNGPVLSHHPFGYFIDLGSSITGLVEIPYAREPNQPITPADYPPVGSGVDAVVLFANPQQRQIRLSARPSDIAHARQQQPHP